MSTPCEQFNITIEELLNELACIFDNLHEQNLIQEDGSFMNIIALALQQWKNEELIQSFCENHSIWHDCYERKVEFLLKDFSKLFAIQFDDFNKLQVPAKIFMETKGQNPAITNEDIEFIFDYLVALGRHACRYIITKRITDPNYMAHFPIDNYKANFGL